MKKILSIIAVIAVLGGCATTPPVEYSFVKERQYEKSYDQVWGKIVKYFAINNVDIKAIEKESGIISAERGAITSEYADCESFIFYRIDNILGNFNTLVEKGDKVKVTVNTSYKSSGMETLNNIPMSKPCRSKGKLETEILEYIAK